MEREKMKERRSNRKEAEKQTGDDRERGTDCDEEKILERMDWRRQGRRDERSGETKHAIESGDAKSMEETEKSDDVRKAGEEPNEVRGYERGRKSRTR